MKVLIALFLSISTCFATYNPINIDRNILSRAQVSDLRFKTTPAFTPQGMAYFGSQYGQIYCSVGLNGTAQGSSIYSPNGDIWTTGSGFANKAYSGVAVDDFGHFVAVSYDVSSGSEFMTSVDCQTWTTGTNSSMGRMRSVIWANGLFVAVGERIMTSTNGTTWTLRYTNPGAQEIRNVVYGNGKFVAVIDNLADATGNVLTSTDGITWTKPTDPDVISRPLGDIAFGNGIFVAPQYGQGNLVYSKDGVNWYLLAYGNLTSTTIYNFPKISFNGYNFHIFLDGVIYTGYGNASVWTYDYGPNCSFSKVKFDGRRYVGGLGSCAAGSYPNTNRIFTSAGSPASF